MYSDALFWTSEVGEAARGFAEMYGKRSGAGAPALGRRPGVVGLQGRRPRPGMGSPRSLAELGAGRRRSGGRRVRAMIRRAAALALMLAAPALGQPNATATAPAPKRSPLVALPGALPGARPKIGIAFSGGGAKGCAHIGVLKVLEEMRIPIDYAAGTSMGAIVGGLYASGLDTDELAEAILTVDWADALTDKPSRKDRSIRRKDDDLRYIPDLELGLGRKGLKYPTGLRSGQKLGLLLRTLTMPVRTVENFDDLTIPFRAVATDIATGGKVVLDHGDFAHALRASMAIPTVFSAVEIDGKLLVDGGISDNVPVDVVRGMGADVVIAIDIGSPLLAGPEAGRSFLTILNQTMGLITRANMAPQLAAADLVITPEVAAYGTLEFSAGREIIAKGEAEARKLADRLRPYALSEEDYLAWKGSRQRLRGPIPAITSVRVEGNQRVDSRVLAAQVELQPGTPYAADAAREDLSRIFGLGDFESADAELVPEGDGEGGTALVYRVREKHWGPTYLRAGISFEANGQGAIDFGLLASVNRTRINALGAEWKTQLEFGSTAFLGTGFYQPLSFSRGWFVEPGFSYTRRDVPLYVESDRVAEFDVREATSRLDLGYAFGRFGELRLGLADALVEPQRQTGTVPEEYQDLVGESFHKIGLTFAGVVDRLDSATLPKNGSYTRLAGFYSLPDLGADDAYSKIELKASRYGTRGRHTLFGVLNGGISPGEDNLPIYDQFVLGGFFSLAAFERGELRGDNFGLLRFGYYYRLGKVLHFGGFVEAARVAALPEDILQNPVFTATAMMIADTAFGPLYLAFSGAEEGRRELYIIFGRHF